MSAPGRGKLLVLAVAGTAGVCAAAPPPAAAIGLGSVCGVAGVVSGAAGKLCSVVGGAGSSLPAKAGTALVLAAVVAWVSGGARFALGETAHVIGQTTTPQLTSTWFSSTYWRVAGIAAVLTLPFLFAAAIQALVSSDLPLLLRSSCGYLPLALLCVGVAAPVTMLLLSATDQLCVLVSSAAGDSGSHFLNRAAGSMGVLTWIESPFIAFFAGLLTVAAALALWVELLARAAAVYVIVLMLPLVFASFVWPARRMWTVRAVELLVALILSKFVMVAVLALGGAALSHSFLSSVTGLVAGVALLGMGVCAPWALVRLLPMAEVAAGAAASLSGELSGLGGRLTGAGQSAQDAVSRAQDWPREASADMPTEADIEARTIPAETEPAAGALAPASESHREGEPSPEPDGERLGAVAEPPGPGAVAATADVPQTDAPGPPGASEAAPEPDWKIHGLAGPTLELRPDEDWPPRGWPATEADGGDPSAEDPAAPSAVAPPAEELP